MPPVRRELESCRNEVELIQIHHSIEKLIKSVDVFETFHTPIYFRCQASFVITEIICAFFCHFPLISWRSLKNHREQNQSLKRFRELDKDSSLIATYR